MTLRGVASAELVLALMFAGAALRLVVGGGSNDGTACQTPTATVTGSGTG